MSSNSRVENKILRCINDGLEALGEKGKQALQRHLEQDIDLRREDIPEKPQLFCKELNLIFGERGAEILVKNIVRKLLKSFDLKKKSDLTLAGVIEMIKAGQKKPCRVGGQKGGIPNLYPERRRKVEMNEIELKLISELMKNSRRSDRELARAIGTSQSTVNRMIRKLEKEGIIKEYTMIPDFAKLGYTVLAFTLARIKPGLTKEEIEKARKTATEFVGKKLPQVVMFERLPTAGSTLTLSYHRDYSAYLEFIKTRNQHSFVDADSVTSYLVDLKDMMRSQFRPLTFSTLATHIFNLEDEKKE